MSDQGPEAPKDYTESVKSATKGALDQVQGTYNRASGQVRNADRSGSRSHPRSILDRYRRGLRDRDHRGATWPEPDGGGCAGGRQDAAAQGEGRGTDLIPPSGANTCDRRGGQVVDQLSFRPRCPWDRTGTRRCYRTNRLAAWRIAMAARPKHATQATGSEGTEPGSSPARSTRPPRPPWGS
jgi:hypothetical protein